MLFMASHGASFSMYGYKIPALERPAMSANQPLNETRTTRNPGHQSGVNPFTVRALVDGPKFFRSVSLTETMRDISKFLITSRPEYSETFFVQARTSVRLSNGGV